MEIDSTFLNLISTVRPHFHPLSTDFEGPFRHSYECEPDRDKLEQDANRVEVENWADLDLRLGLISPPISGMICHQ
jgi:hypothetical protein